MKNRSLFLILFAIGFVGATSCGDNNQNSQLAAENAALRQMLAQRSTAVQSVNLLVTQSATSVAYATQTVVSGSSGTGSNTASSATNTYSRQ